MYLQSFLTGSGLKVETSCTTTSDTVCEPLEGFFCFDSTENNCAAAQKHSSCQPGQYINKTDEYQIVYTCCPACPPGNLVRTHCLKDRATSCLPCTDGTFMAKATGRRQCYPCTPLNCDAGLGLKTLCTTTSDTVCEPLEGFFCIDSTENNCAAAQKHSSCQPGQYINKTGTAFTDTVCSDCSAGTFSDGTFTSCQEHTQCESVNRHLIKAGTASSDAECGEESSNVPAAVTIPVLLFLFICVGLVLFFYFKKKKAHLKLVGGELETETGF
uniref:TNFR-Cys domain-containing protein n=1 Tax=Stegastes partitus TaxID=144197 RepID=A0A3B4YVG7_9TELE